MNIYIKKPIEAIYFTKYNSLKVLTGIIGTVGLTLERVYPFKANVDGIDVDVGEDDVISAMMVVSHLKEDINTFPPISALTKKERQHIEIGMALATDEEGEYLNTLFKA